MRALLNAILLSVTETDRSTEEKLTQWIDENDCTRREITGPGHDPIVGAASEALPQAARWILLGDLKYKLKTK